jgi:DNA-binding transcriptional LysR family regulator
VINNSTFGGVEAFVAVAETLAFRAAAERLGVTPAAVSRSVQRLEDRLGVRLFERTTRRVRLTREGERFAARCREAVAQLRLGEEEAQAVRGAVHGTLTVSASPILARLVTSRLARFALRHPAVTTELRFTDRVVRFDEEEGLDVALRVGGVHDESLAAKVLLRPRWTTVASPAYLARHGRPRTVGDLAGHACVAFVTFPTRRVRAWTFAGEAFTPRGPIATDLGEALVDAALGGVGVAQVLDFMVTDHLRDGRLVELLADRAAPGPDVLAVHRAGRSLPRIRAFVDFLVEDLRA